MDKKQFLHIFNNSLKIIINDNSNSIFFVYNKSIERQIKYNRLFNFNKQIKYTLNINDILFKQDINNRCLWYDYDKIYLKLKEHNEYKKLKINNLIKSWLVDETNWNQYTPLFSLGIRFFKLVDETNWNQYTPHSTKSGIYSVLDDDTNWNQYTPCSAFCNSEKRLDDDTNWKQYTSADIHFTQTFELDDDIN